MRHTFQSKSISSFTTTTPSPLSSLPAPFFSTNLSTHFPSVFFSCSSSSSLSSSLSFSSSSSSLLRFFSSSISPPLSLSFSISFSSFLYITFVLWLFITTFFPFSIPSTAYALMDVHTISPKENDVFILPIAPPTIDYDYLLGKGSRFLLELPMNLKPILRPPLYLSDPIIQHFWIRINPIHSEAQASTYYFKLSSPDVHALDFVVQTYGYDPSKTNHTNFPLQSNCLPPCQKYLRVTCFTNSYSYEPFTDTIIVIVEEEKLILNLLAPSILENLLCSLLAGFIALYFIYPKVSSAFDQIHFICSSPSSATNTTTTATSLSSSRSLSFSTSEALLKDPLSSNCATSPLTTTTTTTSSLIYSPTSPLSSSCPSAFSPTSSSTSSSSSSSSSCSSSMSNSSKLLSRSFSFNDAPCPNETYIEE